MKIGLVCPYNLALGGGVQVYVTALREGLERRGHEAVIITPQPRDDGDHYSREHVIFVGNGTEFRTPLATRNQLSVSVDTQEIEVMLEREKFDILHFHEPWIPVLSRQIASRSHAVNIATFHAKLPETLVGRTMQKVIIPYTKSALEYLHTLTAVSEAAAEYVSTLTDAPITIIPDAIDLSQYKPSKHESKLGQPKTILYIGRLERRKGVKYLLKAYAQLQAVDDNIQLIIAGDGPDREKLEEYAADLGLGNVSFLGFVKEAEKLQLLQTADLFCSPALFGESFGIVLLEAMACGLPAVAGDNSGYSSLMQDMGALSLVNPRETDEFARRLRLLLNEPKLRSDWQAWAKQYVKQFDYPKVIERYEDLYKYSLEHHAQHVTVLAEA